MAIKVVGNVKSNNMLFNNIDKWGLNKAESFHGLSCGTDVYIRMKSNPLQLGRNALCCCCCS